MSFQGKLIAIAGPTASGKTDAAYALAEMYKASIVSADCFQSYKKLDIGTSKPPREMLEVVKHYMINEYEITCPVNVYEYAKRSCEYIASIKGEVCIVTGGSGLYLDSIIYRNYEFSKENSDRNYREYLMKFVEERGADALYDKLIEIDPEYAAKTHRNNVKRVMRAIEFNHETGKKMSQAACEKVMRHVNTDYYGLYVDRAVLYERINKRVDRMVEEGLIDEVRSLYGEYNNRDLNAFKAIGYKEIISAIENEISFDDAIELIKKRSRNYAKRQYTWFNADKNIKWIDATRLSCEQIAEIIYGGENV
ncbi:MAG: tRNA (adenosine(37)-N6)-dimethylallyltransferase MiaA [Eubacteriaceae bacterium]|nr:tRNA (adenosine(37)-N6)-dimethylallyltransferase MiaA [Eubacteriaceae bacterium]